MMRFRSFADRVALGGETVDRRLAWRILAAIAIAYSVGFFAFYPQVVTNDDEAMFMEQARLLVRGETSVTKIDPFTGESSEYSPYQYVVGTAALMAPFMLAGGWKAGYLVPFLSLLAGVLLTARWLHEEGRSPIFALLILGFPACLVLGRVVMSDVPSLAIASLGLWLFWRGIDRPWPNWLASGFVAGASMAVRETNPLVFVPFFAGTVLRRESKCWALVVGGLLGLALHLAASWWSFESAVHVRGFPRFDLISAPERLPVYALGLLVFVPAGLILAPLYRGPRRAEVITTIFAFVAFYVSQVQLAPDTSFSKRLVTGLRYVIPVLPVIAFAMAESVPRLARRLIDGWGRNHRPRLRALFSAVILLWIIGVLSAAVSVHWALGRWSRAQGGIQEAIAQFVPSESVLVLNYPQTFKFSGALDRRFELVDRARTSLEEIEKLWRRHGEFHLVLLDRSDSAFHRGDVAANAAFIGSLNPPPELLFDREFSATDRLRIWRVTELRIDADRHGGEPSESQLHPERTTPAR
jgi:hypothetical protein